MNINSLTIKAQEALQGAVSLAKERGQQAVEPMHLLSALIAEDDSLSAFLLGRVGVNARSLREEALPRVSGGKASNISRPTLRRSYRRPSTSPATSTTNTLRWSICCWPS